MEIPRPARTCSVSKREFTPNEPFFSVLSGEEGSFVRKDIAPEHWICPPKECTAWWKTSAKHITESVSQRQNSGETLHDVFERLLTQQEDSDTLYILTLLMLRRKLLRYENEKSDTLGNRHLEVYSPQTNATYQIAALMPDRSRLEIIQKELAEL